MNYQTPGVYVEEIAKLPPSIAPVNTAIPAFIGYTEKRPNTKPHRIKSMLEYQELFGGAFNEITEIAIGTEITFTTSTITTPPTPASPTGIPASPKFKMYYSLLLYFANGGGPCYVVSSNLYTTTTDVYDSMKAALDLVKKEDEPTLLVFPDLTMIGTVAARGTLYQEALAQCALLQDRFAILDTFIDPIPSTPPTPPNPVNTFRNNIGTGNLKYGAVYYPNLETIFTTYVDQTAKIVTDSNFAGVEVLRHSEAAIAAAIVAGSPIEEESLFHVNNEAYHKVIAQINAVNLVLPPSAAIAGVYASVDRTRGVWKAPANVSLTAVSRPTVIIDDTDQELLNIDQNGKSINAIRNFTGKGTIVWGARTLAGNDNEWRYVSVRRFFLMAEESIRNATQQFVFENNDSNTWIKVRTMIANFLTLQWRAGALFGDKANDSFFVKVGLGETMSAQDILEGRMIVEIGMAVVRPAEFIILKFSHFMQEN